MSGHTWRRLPGTVDVAMPTRLVTGPELRRRLRAARELGGFESPKALADYMNQPGLSDRTIRNLEGGVRDRAGRKHPPDSAGRARDLRAIAAACGLPYEWFTEQVNIGEAVLAGVKELWPDAVQPLGVAPPPPPDALGLDGSGHDSNATKPRTPRTKRERDDRRDTG